VLYYFKPALFPSVGQVAPETIQNGVIPVAVLLAGSLTFGNLAYLDLSVSLIQMIKTAIPACVFVLGHFAGVDQLTAGTFASVLWVMVSITAATSQAPEYNTRGLVMQGCSFMFECVRLIALKLLLSSNGCNLDPLSGLYYYAPCCLLVLVVPALMIEGPLVDLARFSTWTLDGVLASNGLMAFSLQVCVVYCMHASSPLAFTLFAQCKDVLLILGASAFFHEALSSFQVACYTSALMGLFAFNHFRKAGAKAAPKPEEKPKSELHRQ
jgi:hypothetical protein